MNKLTQDDKYALNEINTKETALLNRIITNTKTTSSIRTLVLYIKIVRRIYKFNDMVFRGDNIGLLIDNPDYIISFLERRYVNPKDYLWSVIMVLQGFDNTEKVVQIYKKKMGLYIHSNKEKRGENIKNRKQSNNWLEYNEVIKRFNQNKDKLNMSDRFLLSLIIHFPRRLADYYRLKLRYENQKGDMVNDNFIVINKHKVPLRFEFNRQKTSKYENVIKEIPADLKQIIYKYIKNHKLETNQLIFSTLKGTMYSASDFSNKVTKLFQTITDKRITNNIWRHIYVSHFGSDNFSLNEKRQTASNLGHNIETQQEYIKH